MESSSSLHLREVTLVNVAIGEPTVVDEVAW